MLYEEFPTSVLHVEHHVSDILTIPETTARATAYGASGIPHVRCDGQAPVIGAGSCITAYNQYKNRYTNRMAATGGVSPVQITGTWEITPDETETVHATATFELVDPDVLTNWRATILVYQKWVGPEWMPVVTRRIVDESNVTLDTVGQTHVMQADMLVVEGQANPHQNWDTSQLVVIAYLQNPSGFEIIQTSKLVQEGVSSVDEVALNGGVRLLYAQPNPFQPQTRIGFQLSRAMQTDLGVYDLNGRRVATLVEGQVPAGSHEALWNGADDAGNPLASGVYFVRLVSGGLSRVQKVIRVE